MPTEEDPDCVWKLAVASVASMFRHFLGDDVDISVGFYFAVLHHIGKFESGIDREAVEICVVGDKTTEILFEKGCPAKFAGTSKDIDTAGPDFCFILGRIWAEHASLDAALAHLRVRLLKRAQAGDGSGA